MTAGDVVVATLPSEVRETGVYIGYPLFVPAEATYVTAIADNRAGWLQFGVGEDVIELTIEVDVSGKWEVLGACTTDGSEKRGRNGQVYEGTTLRCRLPRQRVPVPQIRVVLRCASRCEGGVELVFDDMPLPSDMGQEHHSVTYDNDNEAIVANATSVTIGTFAIGNNTNRALMVGVASWDATAGDSVVSSVTHNSSTAGWSTVIQATSAAVERATILRKLAPDIVSSTVVVTMGGACADLGASAVSLYGVDQTTPTAGATSAEGFATTITVNVTAAVNDMVLDCIYVWGGSSSAGFTAAAGTGQTARANLILGTSSPIRLLTSTEVGAATVTMSWTLTGTDADREWIQAGCAVKAAAVGTTTPLSLSSSVVPVSALRKVMSKRVSSSVVPVTLLVKRINRSYSSVVVPVSSLRKVTGKVLGSTVTPVSAMLRRVNKSLSSVVVPVTAVIKVGSKRLSSVVVPVSSVSKVVSKTVGSVVTPVSGVVKRVNKSLSSMVTPVSSIVTSTVRALILSSSVMPVTALVKRVSKNVGSAVVPSSALFKMYPRVLNSVVVPVSEVVKRVNKVLGSAVIPVTSIITSLSKVLILSSSVGVVTALVKVVNKSLVSGVVPGSSVVKVCRKVLGSVVVPVTLVVKGVFKAFNSSVTPTTSIMQSAIKMLFLSSFITPVSSVSKVVVKRLGSSVGVVTGMMKVVGKGLGSVVVPVSAFTRRFIQSLVLDSVVTPVTSLVTQFISGTGVVSLNSMYQLFRRRKR